MTPTPQGIIDNIWSALIIYGVVSLFIFDKEKSADLIQEDFFLEFSARTSKYIEFIRQESIKHSADSLLVATVLFYEIKQRPQIIRFLERLFVLISKKETTQGVMQYKTNKLISDHQSISFAIEKYFYNTEEIHTRPDLLIKLLQKYNPSIKYASEVLNLYYGFRKSIHH